MLTLSKINFNSKINQKKENASEVKFKGLNTVLKKRVFFDIKIRGNYLSGIDAYQKSRGIVGNIVHDWIKDIPFDMRKESIRKIYEAFNRASLICREEGDSRKAAQELSQVFKELGLINNREDFKLSLLGKGCSAYGNAFKFRIKETDYVFKNYHDIEHYDKEDGHGSFFEKNRIFFVNQCTNKKNQFAPYYFGNMDLGYTVSKYVSDTDRARRRYPLCLLGLHDFDSHLGNQNREGVIWDYGGLRVIDPVLTYSKQARYDNYQKQLTRIKELLQKEELHQEEEMELAAAISNIVDDRLKIKIFNFLVERQNISLEKVLLNLPREYQLKGFSKHLQYPLYNEYINAKISFAWNVIGRLKKENQLRAFQILLEDPKVITKLNSSEVSSIIERLVDIIDSLAEENKPEAGRLLSKAIDGRTSATVAEV